MFVPAGQIRNTASRDRLAVRRRTETLMRAQTPVPKTVKLYLGLDASDPSLLEGKRSYVKQKLL